MAALGREAMSQLDDATFETLRSDAAVICVCPCSSLGHRSDVVCQILILPGEPYKTARLAGKHPRPAVMCMPCWVEFNERRAGG